MSGPKRKWTFKRIFRALEGASLGILAFLSLFVLTGILSDPSSGSLKLVPVKKYPIMLEESVPMGRGPASIAPMDSTILAPTAAIDLITLDCDNDETISSPSPSVRLRGNSCNGLEIAKSEIKNVTNENTATVFQKSQWFTTDLIQLEPGNNKIEIRHTLTDGSTESYVRQIEKK